MPEESSNAAPAPQRNTDEIALEMMKFVAVTTGYGKGGSTAGFGGKGAKTPEEYAEALLQLFDRCRTVINKEKG
jgi:ATP:corrinoid adenosyltransferase